MTAIITKYIPSTNTKGTRISATCAGGHKVTFPAGPFSGNAPHRFAALALCEQLGWEGDLIEGNTVDGNVYVFVGGLRIPNPMIDPRRAKQQDDGTGLTKSLMDFGFRMSEKNLKKKALPKS